MNVVEKNADARPGAEDGLRIQERAGNVHEGGFELTADCRAYEDAIAADDGVRYTTDEVMRMAIEAR